MTWPEPTDADLGCNCDDAFGEVCPLCAPFDWDDEDRHAEELHGRTGVDLAGWRR